MESTGQSFSLYKRLVVLEVLMAVLVFMIGASSGVAIAEFGMVRQLSAAAPITQTAQLVLVVQTATPEVTAAQVVPPTPAAASPTVEVMPDVAVSETLSGAHDGMRLGSAQAPVQVVVFADPQCPFCRQLALGAERQLIDEYVTPGKAALTYRHFAFLGAESVRSAQALECAGRQGAETFWRFHRQVYDNQLPENSGQLIEAKLLAWARAAGLNGDRFTACLSDAGAKAAVEADLALGQRLGVRGTPVIFVNGKRVVGAVPYEMLKAVVDAAVARQP